MFQMFHGALRPQVNARRKKAVAILTDASVAQLFAPGTILKSTD